jgi:hypothetical protein
VIRFVPVVVMTVRQRMTGYHLLFGWYGTTTNHVRWLPAPPAPANTGAGR